MSRVQARVNTCPMFPRTLCSVVNMLVCSQIMYAKGSECREQSHTFLFLLYQGHVIFSWSCFVLCASVANRDAPDFLFFRPHGGQGASMAAGSRVLQLYFPLDCRANPPAAADWWTQRAGFYVLSLSLLAIKLTLYHLSPVWKLSVLSDLESCTGFCPGWYLSAFRPWPFSLYSTQDYSLSS